jgi:ferredoxin/coenzyme F420-reducing hydrogenase delta subunit
MQIQERSPEPPTRGEALWRALERPWLAADRALGRVLPTELNPLALTGALAFLTFVVAVGSGVPLLFWYSPSSTHAHSSLAELDALGRVVRSLHRYSSDGCLLFTALHALRLLVARRSTGARWLAWVTGAALVGLLWFVGWLGYWLVWDERGRQVALGSARLVDALPIFSEPLSMSFVTDDAVRPLLFFVVFFLHMLLPLAMGALLWIHLARLQRPRWWPARRLMVWALGSMLVLSVALPADLVAPARMLVEPRGFAIDAWYLAPLAFTDRLAPGALWAIVLGAGAVVFAVPWLLAGRRRAAPAEVQESHCNACRVCMTDCPYNAIDLAPRADGRKFDGVARVDPSRCVGCGICVGSCDSNGIDVPLLRVQGERKELDGWLDGARARGEAAPLVVFACAGSAAAGLRVDATSGTCAALPGALVVAVPCAGWVHALTVERALRHGAAGVLVVSCAHGEPMYREGPSHTAARLAGQRRPALRLERCDPARVRVVALDRGERAALVGEATAFASALRAGAPALRREARRPPRRAVRVVAALGTAGALTALVGAGSVVPYATPASERARLVVAFVHPGKTGEHCRTVSPEELAQQPVHMRQEKVCERGRAPVRVRVAVDGAVVLERRYAPGGVFGDGPSVVHERLAVAPGTHSVSIAIADTLDGKWTHQDQRSLTLEPRHAHVIRFDRAAGFHWY